MMAISKLLLQIISYCRQSSLQFSNVGRLWHVSLIPSAFQHCVPYIAIPLDLD